MATRLMDESQWQAVKRMAVASNRPSAVRVLDNAMSASLSVLAQRFQERNPSLPMDTRAMYLWDNVAGYWSGPFNLSAPGELQHYLAKRDDRGRAVFSLSPPEKPVHVRASGTDNKSVADSKRGGRSRRHRGRRRGSDGS